MSKWLYIMSNSDNTYFHCGFSDDILKVIRFYDSLPKIGLTPCSKLVYAEEYTLKETQVNRFKELTSMGTEKMKEIIEVFNPGYVQITEKMIAQN